LPAGQNANKATAHSMPASWLLLLRLAGAPPTTSMGAFDLSSEFGFLRKIRQPVGLPTS
jgi:hypothetical protein